MSTFVITLGSSNAGKLTSLTGAVVSDTGAVVSSLTSSAFVEIGGGFYLLSYSAPAAPFSGAVTVSLAGVVVAASEINISGNISTGPNIVTVGISSGTAAVAGAFVVFVSSAGVPFPYYTNSNGTVVAGLPSDSYTVSISASGYIGQTATLVVSGNVAQSYSLKQIPTINYSITADTVTILGNVFSLPTSGNVPVGNQSLPTTKVTLTMVSTSDQTRIYAGETSMEALITPLGTPTSAYQFQLSGVPYGTYRLQIGTSEPRTLIIDANTPNPLQLGGFVV